MKNVRPKPNNPTETRAIPARTQIAAQNSELGIIDLHRIQESYIAPSPRQQSCPAAADTPGVRRWSPEDGGEGLRRVLLLRPLVRRKATIKSTSAMRYSALVKTNTIPISQTPFPYNKAPQANRSLISNRSLADRLQVGKFRGAGQSPA